jgi:glutamyl-tRNA synthetase
MTETVKMKTRFCPSPTGLMHLGNVRTALFNALLAKSKQGHFLLRIEDTDRERSEASFTEMLMYDLKWLGLAWDEGPEKSANSANYYQSQRADIYNEYYKKLEDAGQAYPCFCSEADLVLMRKIQRSRGKPPRYDGTCRHLTPQEIEKKIADGIAPTLRFRVPDDEVVEFEDLVHGSQRFQTNDIGDFIIRRGDNTAPFLYCNAIDDALMQVTHALRGEDHLTNTPRQILILRALNLPICRYGHMSMIVGPDGAPLAKRHGSRNIKELREQGYLAGAIVNYLARMGHYFGHDQYLSVQDLASQFKVESLSKSPAQFNVETLKFWQKQALMQLKTEELWEWLGTAVKELVPAAHQNAFIELIQPNVLFPEDGLHWAQVIFGKHLTISETEEQHLKKAGSDYFRLALHIFDQSGADLRAITQELKQVLKISGPELFMPLRVALTGQSHGPELAKIIKMMETHEVRVRLESAL